MRRYHRNYGEYDDLLQEARIAFLSYLRNMQESDDIMICKYQIYSALYNYMISMAPVSIPRQIFKDTVKRFSAVPLELAENVCDESRFEDEVDSRLLINAFMETASDFDRKVLEMKLRDCSGKEIVEALGHSKQGYVSRRFSRIKQNIRNYAMGVQAT